VQVVPGDPMQFHLVVSNAGEADAFNVTVRDVLPASSTFTIAQDSGAAGTPDQFSCAQVPADPHTIECTGGRVNAGSSRTIDVFPLAPKNLDQTEPNPGDLKKQLINTALVDPANAIPEGDEANNEDFALTTVRSKVDLSIEKEGPTSATQNQTTSYHITVTNT